MSEETTGAKAIIEFAERRTTPDVVSFPGETGRGIPLFINGKGEAQSLMALEDERADHPRRRKGTIQLDTVGSFVELVNRDKRAESVIFASKGKLVAVLNFHHEEAPGFCDDRIVYNFPFSEEWNIWRGFDGKKMDQKSFAEFMEDRAYDVGVAEDAGSITKAFAAPLKTRLAGPGELATLAEGLNVRVEDNVENTYNPQSGESTMVFKSAHKDEAGQPIKVPGAFHIMIPIVDGGPKYSIPVRLRYRVSGKVTWHYDLYRPDIFLKHALEETIKTVKEGCALPVYMGSI
jgi:uncharacterized protein YfdQ (DUF2303 family)